MNGDDIDHLCGLLKARLGLVLTRDKAYLLQSRLGSIARSRGLKDAGELLNDLRLKPTDHTLLQEVSDAMTTNESLFFRDKTPFDNLRDVILPHLIKARAGRRSLRIWSAACSSGQEPYSIAMILKEVVPSLESWRTEIIATDVSTRMIARAREGLYTDFEVRRGLPDSYRTRFFRKEEDGWRIDPELRRIVSFQISNLLHDASALGTFDIIFCRNVLIYFDQIDKTRVLASLRRQLADDGYLFLGGAETVFGLSDQFQPVMDARGAYAAALTTATASAAAIANGG